MGKEMSTTSAEMIEFQLDFSTLEIQRGAKLIGLPHTTSIVVPPAEPAPPLYVVSEREKEKALSPGSE